MSCFRRHWLPLLALLALLSGMALYPLPSKLETKYSIVHVDMVFDEVYQVLGNPTEQMSNYALGEVIRWGNASSFIEVTFDKYGVAIEKRYVHRPLADRVRIWWVTTVGTPPPLWAQLARLCPRC
jgi:hypothetical protein